MKTSVPERYAVAIENYGHLEGGMWFETLTEARKYAAEIRAEVNDLEQKHEVLVLKILRV